MHEQFDELIRGAKAGDDRAINDVLAASRSYLNVLAAARTEPWMRAKFDPSDVVQQTLVDANGALGRFDGESEGQWKAYLKQMLLNNLQDAIRQYRVAERRNVDRERDLHFNDGGLRPLANQDPTPSRTAADAERDFELAAAIDSLPDDYREVVIARNLRKEPFSQIADAMGRSEAATQMLWTRAIRKLQSVLQGRSELAD